MKKIFLIGWKDVRLAFRDRAALILMLLAPFLLTVGLGFVTGRFSSSTSSGISDIPVILVNQDKGLIGNSLIGLFTSADLKGLIAATESNDPSVSRKQVDADLAAAAIIIPPGFTGSIIAEPGATGTVKTVQIELYLNPTRPTSVGVVKTILDDFVSRLEVGRIAGQVVVTQLLSHGLIQEQDAPTTATRIWINQANSAANTTSILLKSVTNGGKTVPFDVLAYIAPGMALMFLMYTVSYGGRTLLAERTQGTLPRLLISPTSTSQVLGGKVFGIFLTGAAQMLILIFASTLLFNLQWGDTLGVLALVLAAVVGAGGWGMLITAIARTPNQVSTVGSALMLIFAIMGGSLVSLNNMPPWFKFISKITPNAWGLDGFSTLGLGGTLKDIVIPIFALLVMGAILFTIAVFLFNRLRITQQ